MGQPRHFADDRLDQRLNPTGDFQLRGKQVLNPGGIMYTRVSGIWQSVWLETVSRTYIERLRIDTAIDPATITVRTFAGGEAAENLAIRVTASFAGNRSPRPRAHPDKRCSGSLMPSCGLWMRRSFTTSVSICLTTAR